jgi:hypothetical protein
MKNLFLLLCACFVALSCYAQDKIYTKLQKNPIDGEVVEIGVNDIKYKPADHSNLTIAIDKQDVVKIIYKNGQVNIITNPMQDLTFYQGQHLNNLKVSIINIATGSTQLFYERGIKPGKSIEYELNLIGLGNDQKIGSTDYTMQQLGLGVGIGAKYIRLPDFVSGNVRLRHLMQGAYLEPAISVNVYQRNFYSSAFDTSSGSYSGSTDRKTCFAIHPHITMGKEWIMDNSVSVDIYGLLGYSFDNLYSNYTSSYSDGGNNLTRQVSQRLPFNGFGYTRSSKGDMGLSWGVGFRVGYLFDWKWTDKRAQKHK